MAKITSFTPSRLNIRLTDRNPVLTRYFLADTNETETNRVSVRNEKDGLTRYPSPYEPMPLTTGSADPTTGVDLEDVVILDEGTTASIIADSGDGTDVVVIAVVSGDPPTVTETDPDTTAVDEYYDDQGNTISVLTDGNEVIGVRG